jgi:hypothetical protein
VPGWKEFDPNPGASSEGTSVMTGSVIGGAGKRGPWIGTGPIPAAAGTPAAASGRLWTLTLGMDEAGDAPPLGGGGGW